MKIKDKINLNCQIKRNGKKIYLVFNLKTSLTDLREFIARNSKNIKNLQKQIRQYYGIKKEKRYRERFIVNELRDE